MSLSTSLHNLFLRLYLIDQQVRAFLPGPVLELIGGALLALAAGSLLRATAINAGYEILVDQHNDSAKDGFLDFAIRQAVILVAFLAL